MTTLAVVVLILYFLPLIVAWAKHHRQAWAIGALNLFLGWTFIGWVVSLVWALTDDTKTSRRIT